MVKNFMAGPVVKASEVPVTILMPIHPKDLWIAGHSIDSLRKNLLHPIEEILIVSKKDPEIQDWCAAEDLKWIDESQIFDWTVERIGKALPDWARSRDGWLFQQLLKFSVNKFSTADSFLIVDADTLLLKKKTFHLDGKVRLDYSHERNLLYLQTYKELLGQKPSSWVSFVTHHVFMEKKVLQELKSEIEKYTGKPWEQAIIEMASSDIWSDAQKKVSPFNYFSEYETYGNFCKSYYEEVKSNYFWNYASKDFDPDVLSIEEYVAKLPSIYSWVSFHSYNRRG